jgi:hypothetical protein
VPAAIRVPKQHDGSAQLLLSPTGKYLGVFTHDSGNYQKTALAVYSTADNACVGGPLELGDCRGLGFISDGTLLIGNARCLLRWRVPDEPASFGEFGGAFLYALGVQPRAPVFSVVVESDYCGAMSGWQILVHDIKTGEPVSRIAAPIDLHMDSATLSPRGRFAAAELSTYRHDGRGLLICETATGRRVQTFYSTQRVWGMTFTPNEKALFAFLEVWNTDEQLAVYEFGSADPVRILRVPDGTGAMCFARDGSTLDILCHTGARVRLDPKTGRVLKRYKAPTKLAHYSSAVLSANGRVAAAITARFTVAVWALDG